MFHITLCSAIIVIQELVLELRFVTLQIKVFKLLSTALQAKYIIIRQPVEMREQLKGNKSLPNAVKVNLRTTHQ